MKTVLAFVLAVFGTTVAAQSTLGCPSGPFECVPWTGPGVGGPGPLPPFPLFEVAPTFLQAEAFHGFVGRGAGTNLDIAAGALPTDIIETLVSSGISMNPDRLYVMPLETNEAADLGNYLIFNGLVQE